MPTRKHVRSFALIVCSLTQDGKGAYPNRLSTATQVAGSGRTDTDYMTHPRRGPVSRANRPWIFVGLGLAVALASMGCSGRSRQTDDRAQPSASAVSAGASPTHLCNQHRGADAGATLHLSCGIR